MTRRLRSRLFASSLPFANLMPTGANGAACSRSTSHVLNIVYLGGAGGGGFFPAGMNGVIR